MCARDWKIKNQKIHIKNVNKTRLLGHSKKKKSKLVFILFLLNVLMLSINDFSRLIWVLNVSTQYDLYRT